MRSLLSAKSTGFLHSVANLVQNVAHSGQIPTGFPLLQKAVHKMIHRFAIAHRRCRRTFAALFQFSTAMYYYYGV